MPQGSGGVGWWRWTGGGNGERERVGQRDEETEGDGIVEVRDNGGEEVVRGEFADDLFESIATRKQQTRKENREKRRTYGLERAKDRPAKDRQGIEYPNIAATEMKELQNTDETLATVVEGNGVFRREGVLYRRWVPRGQPEECGVDQIILPKKLRSRAPDRPLHSTRGTPRETKDGSKDHPKILLAHPLSGCRGFL